MNVTKRLRKDYGMKPEEFARTWQSSASLKEFFEKTGMPPQIASARANKMRKYGVHLKRMKRVNRNIDVAHLNQIIDQMAKEPRAGRPTAEAVRQMLGKVGNK